MDNFSLTDHRSFSTIERQMIWQKPASHRTSSVELRIAAG